MAQTMHNPATGLNEVEFFTGPSIATVQQAMDERRAELEAAGQSFVKRTSIGRNTTCPCGSGLKFKKCCIGRAHLVGFPPPR
jgi:uncharacterized protein YecA (UPF0149 family)